MRNFTLFIVTVLFFSLALATEQNEGSNDNINWLEYLKPAVQKRRSSDPSDPRNLFAAIYG
jgi:hypothetical protein